MKFLVEWDGSPEEGPLLPIGDSTLRSTPSSLRGQEQKRHWLSLPGLRHICLSSLTPNSLPTSISFRGKATPKVTGVSDLVEKAIPSQGLYPHS